jgi:hypothetical protein
MRPAWSLLAALGLTVTTVGAPATLAQSTAADAPAAIEAQGGAASGGADRGAASQPAARPTVGRAQLTSAQDPFLRGQVLLRQTGPNQTAVIVTVWGLEPGSEHVNHIHNGSCSGSILFPLEKLVADKTGVARAVSSVPGALNPDTWWVQVHAGYALPSPGITCGQVERPPEPPARPSTAPSPRSEGGDRPSPPPGAPPERR